MATYSKIQEYVKINYDFSVKTCWIAHMKELHGLPVRVAYNRINTDLRENPCPFNKQGAITSAFKYFDMI